MPNRLYYEGIQQASSKDPGERAVAMKTVSEAQSLVLQHVQCLEAETVPIECALGRVLAEDVQSNRNHPPYDVSAMDGYAVRAADLAGAGRKRPVALPVVDEIMAGARPRGPIGPGQAAMIMTGAAVPEGADAVVRVEDTSRRSHKGRHAKESHPDMVEFWLQPQAGDHIRPLGENMKSGETVLTKGMELSPAAIAMLAMVKQAVVRVHRRPTVAIVATGDELEALHAQFDPARIPNSNSYSTMAQLMTQGIDPVLLPIARDSREHLKRSLKQGLEFDVLITTGGVSVGHHDYVRPVLDELGIKMHFWRVAMRPGHPMAFGPTANNLVFALPGNPVASMVCTEQFVLPAMRKMMGFSRLFRSTVTATLSHDVQDRAGRMHFMRARLSGEEGALTVTSVGAQGSGILMSMVRANALMIVPAERDSLRQGEHVRVQTLDGNCFQAEPRLECP